MGAKSHGMDISKLLRKIEELGPAWDKPVAELVISEAKGFVSTGGTTPGMVQVTPPAHQGVIGNEARYRGEDKAEADIRRVYLNPAKAFDDIKASSGLAAAKAFWVAFMGKQTTTKKGKVRRSRPALDEVQRLLRKASSRYRNITVGPFDGGAAHRAARRKSDGTVPKKTLPRYLATTQRALGTYIKGRRKNVGLYGSSLAGIAGDLGIMNRLPAWMRRHGNPFGGSVRKLKSKQSFHVVMRIRPPFAGKDMSRRANYVVKYRIKSMMRRMPYVINQALKKAKLAA